MDNSVYIHPKALVESDQIGDGTRVWAFAHVMKGAIIGSDCNICDHSFVESSVTIGNRVKIKNGVAVWEKVTIEDDVFLGPNCVLTNDINPRAAIAKGSGGFLPTLIKKGATIGANATIVCGITLGQYAFVAAGAVVTRDVPDYALMVGVPAKIKGYICQCGEKIDFSKICICGRKYEFKNNICQISN
jgi:UDP-2-acetamido-3-amino-2,3-dideoxy-glucuronate N-acetyltransferase